MGEQPELGRRTGEERSSAISDLFDLLNVDRLDEDQFSGRCRNDVFGRVFGGQILAQSLLASERAGRNIDREPHSLHAYFLRPADAHNPILYRVTTEMEGRSFAMRRVMALQNDVPILIAMVSFQRPEEGIAHQVHMPNVATPDAARAELNHWNLARKEVPGAVSASVFGRIPVEIVPIEPSRFFSSQARAPRQACWLRVEGADRASASVNRALIVYVSDMLLLRTATLPHAVPWGTDGVRSASLDHAIWLHRTPRLAEWHLYVTDSPWAGRARGFSQGRIFREDGDLVSSIGQEGVIRIAAKAKDEPSIRSGSG